MRYRQGLHFHAQGAVAVELIEPETGTPLTLTEGAKGELVYTHLLKEAQPLVRYRARDVVRILGTGAMCLWANELSLPYPGSQR